MKQVDYEDEHLVSEYLRITYNGGIWRSELDSIRTYCSFDDNILDVGCGTGRIAYGLYQNGYKNIYGIDISESMIHQAIVNTSEDNAIKYISADIVRECPFDDVKFRLAIFGYNGLMCIRGINNRINALDHIHKLLRKDGIFVFTAQFQCFSPESKHFELWNERRSVYHDRGISELEDSFGDLFVEDKGNKVFHHFTSDFEITKMLGNKWLLLDSFWRDERFAESCSTLQYSNNCKFFVLQKKEET
ncbi:MAG: class I SAM-dependent methyltransferase [Lachnospiraceae bacterium]|nr:class I SAM-dependent methyltransferase [Lachnospiraceae bacterium]